jgi:uncharacterized SAM-binding protein YcdF (DUF218 family)
MILALLCFVAFLSFIVAFAKGVHNAGNISGSIFSICFILYYFLGKKLPDLIYLSQIIYFIKFILVVWMIYFIAESIAMVKYIFFNRPPNNQTEDNKRYAIIVLGCRVKGRKPTKMLSQRIKRAYKEFLSHDDSVIIASGGKGSDEIISEAECIKSELVSLGISENRIFLEDKSKNTYENILFSKKICDEKLSDKNTQVIIVSNEFHLYRAYHIAEKFGIKAYTSPAQTSFYLLLTFWIRELLAITKNNLYFKRKIKRKN